MKMLSNGLGEESYNQLNRVFDVYKKYEEIESNNNYTSIENEIYIDAGFLIKRSFVNSLGVFRPKINVTDMGMRTMKLVNNVNFKGAWKIPFDSTETKIEPFHDETGHVVTGYVEMMHSYGEYSFALIDSKVFVLEMEYADPRYSMIIMLPLNVTMTTADLCELNVFEWMGKLDKLMKKYTPSAMDLYMVKFEMTNKNDMGSILRDMNIVNIFNPKSSEDFSKISDTSGLYISSITQNTKITVEEAGTEASSKTEATLAFKFGPDSFRLDRPFNFHIIDKQKSLILFKGAFTQPTYMKSEKGLFV